MMPKNVAMASGFTLGFSVGLGTMGVLALGWVADNFGILFVFDILVVLPILGFVLTLFIREPGRFTKENYVPKPLSHTRN